MVVLGLLSAVWSVERKDGSLLVRANVPGIKPDGVKIEIENDILTVSGEHEERKEEKDKHSPPAVRSCGSPPQGERVSASKESRPGASEISRLCSHIRSYDGPCKLRSSPRP